MKTWVSYAPNVEGQALPKLRPGVLGLEIALTENRRERALLDQLNLLYAKDYDWQKDLAFIWRYRRDLGN